LIVLLILIPTAENPKKGQIKSKIKIKSKKKPVEHLWTFLMGYSEERSDEESPM